MKWKTLSLLAAVLVPLTLVAGSLGGAIGNFRGNVLLNGRAVPSSTALFPGDELTTGHDGGAFISRAGLAMSVNRDSSAQLLPSGARVVRGSAEATVKPGTVIEYSDLRISAASETSRMKIVANSGSEVIAAVSGDLKVTDGATTVTIPQGKALYAKLSEPAGALTRGGRGSSYASPANAIQSGSGSYDPPAAAIKQGAGGIFKNKMAMTLMGGAAAGGALAAVQATMNSSNVANAIVNIGGSISPSTPGSISTSTSSSSSSSTSSSSNSARSSR